MNEMIVEQRQISISEAVNTVLAIKQHTYTMGVNDFEEGAFKKILEGLQSGNLTPQQAILDAEKIKGLKNDR